MKISDIQFNPYQTPPNMDIAHKHLKANRIHQKELHPKDRCPCCGRNANNEKYKMDSQDEDFAYMGIVFTFFFKLQKFQIYIFLLVFLIVGVVSIWKINVTFKCLLRKNCDYDILYNQYKDNLVLIRSLSIVAIVIIMIWKLYFAFQMKKIQHDIDMDYITVDDYTIYVSGLDKKITDQEIIQKFEKYGKIVKINRIYKIKKIYENVSTYIDQEDKKQTLKLDIQKVQDLEQKLQDSNIDDVSNTEKIGLLITNYGEQKVFQNLQKTQQILKKSYSEAIQLQQQYIQNSQQFFSGSCYIIFQEETSMRQIVKETQGFWLCKKNEFKNLKIQRGPNPLEIIWQDLGYSFYQKLKRRIITILILIGILILDALIVTGLQVLQIKITKNKSSNANKNSHYYLSLIISILISIVVATFCFIISKVLTILTNYEYRPLKSLKIYSVTMKLSLFYFITYALIILFIYTVVFEAPIYRIDGLAQQIFIIQIEDLIIDPLYTFFEPFYWMKKYKRNKVIKQIQNGEPTINQKSANDLYNGEEFYFASFAALNFFVFSFALFFSPIIPLGLLLGLVEIILTFLAIKWVLIKRCKIPQPISFVYCEKLLKFFELSFVLWGSAFIIFDYLILKEVALLSWIFAGLCLLQFTVFSVSLVFNMKNRFEVKENFKKFSQFDFGNEYDRQNPVTHRSSYKNYLKKYKLINDQEGEAIIQKNQDFSDITGSIYDYITIQEGKNFFFFQDNPFRTKDLKISQLNFFQELNFYQFGNKHQNKINSDKANKLLLKKKDPNSYSEIQKSQEIQSLQAFNKQMLKTLKKLSLLDKDEINKRINSQQKLIQIDQVISSKRIIKNTQIHLLYYLKKKKKYFFEFLSLQSNYSFFTSKYNITFNLFCSTTHQSTQHTTFIISFNIWYKCNSIIRWIFNFITNTQIRISLWNIFIFITFTQTKWQFS